MIRISDRYIGRQVLFGTAYAVAVLSIVLVLGRLFQKIRELFVEQAAPLDLVFRFLLSVLPGSLIYTIPWGFLSAVLLVFNRLSANQELTGFRVAGVSLARLSAPVFVIGAMLSGFSLWLNINVVPVGKLSVRDLVKQQIYDQAMENPESLLRPGVAQGNLGDRGEMLKLLIEGKEPDWVTGFHLYSLRQGDQTATYVHASRAALSTQPELGQLRIRLENAYLEFPRPNGGVETVFAKSVEPVVIDVKKPDSRASAGSMTNDQIEEYLAANPDLKPKKQVEFRSEITKRYSFSMACFAFAFIAIPLGLKSRRRDSSSGLTMSLLLGGGYFLFTIVAGEIKSDAGVTLMLWMPNILCILLGLVLFRRSKFK